MRIAVILLVVGGVAAAAHAADVKVTIDGIRNTRGEIHVDLCTEATFLGSDCPFDTAVPTQFGRVTVVLSNIPPGRYAATAYHDENANRDLDLNALGMPTEPYGFSNDPPMLLGPPLFKDAAFDVGERDAEVHIRLRR